MKEKLKPFLSQYKDGWGKVYTVPEDALNKEFKPSKRLLEYTFRHEANNYMLLLQILDEQYHEIEMLKKRVQELEDSNLTNLGR